MVLIDTFVSVGVTSAFILPFRSTLEIDTRILRSEEIANRLSGECLTAGRFWSRLAARFG